MEFLNWWLSCVPMDVQVGAPVGLPAAEHWPGGRGYWRQPAWIVEAAAELRSEWGHLQRGPKPKKTPPKPAPAKRQSRRR